MLIIPCVDSETSHKITSNEVQKICPNLAMADLVSCTLVQHSINRLLDTLI